jgi:antitoxin VapB
MILTKPFMNGRSQALRIPKEFRFDDEEDLFMRKIGDVLMVMPKSKVLDIFENAIRDYPEDAIPTRENEQHQVREEIF